MKDKLKSIIGNGLPYGLVFFALSFILGNLFRVGTRGTLWMSSFIGISALLANGFMYNRFSKPLKELEDISIKIENPELILIQAPANHLIEESLVPGKLFLTNKRIIFKAHGTGDNITKEYSWDRTHLMPISFHGSMFNARGEFLVKASDDILLMFEVNKLKQWKDALRSA